MAAKNALEEATLPPSGHGSSCKLASAIESKIQEYALDNNRSLTEHNVVAAYRHNVFSNIASIASILQFPSSSWNTQFLEMPISDSAHLSADSGRGKRSNYAIADAILRIDPDKHDSAMSAHSRILEDMKITAKYFERIVPFEFKSLSSGSYHTMLGILGHTLQEIFPWQRCSSEYCAYEDGPKLGREPITGDPQGFDAMISAVNLIISDWDGKTKEAYDAMSNKDRTKYTGHGKDMLQQVSLSTLFPISIDLCLLDSYGQRWLSVTPLMPCYTPEITNCCSSGTGQARPYTLATSSNLTVLGKGLPAVLGIIRSTLDCISQQYGTRQTALGS